VAHWGDAHRGRMHACGCQQLTPFTLVERDGVVCPCALATMATTATTHARDIGDIVGDLLPCFGETSPKFFGELQVPESCNLFLMLQCQTWGSVGGEHFW
jgi:hypothetical protein